MDSDDERFMREALKEATAAATTAASAPAIAAPAAAAPVKAKREDNRTRQLRKEQAQLIHIADRQEVPA